MLAKDDGMKQRAILVIDSHRSWEEARLRLEKNFQVELSQVSSADDGKGKLRERYFLAVMLAEDMPGHDPGTFLAEVKAEHPFLPVYLVSRRPTVEGAVAAMREGAQDYLAAPLSWEKPYPGASHKNCPVNCTSRSLWLAEMGRSAGK
jgi:two-component system response regulator FlrC